MANITWTVDPAHTSVEFSVRHLMIASVKGRFREVSGTIVGDPNDFTNARIEAVIKADSVDTAEPDRDAHLRSADFFDVEKYPEITFKSTQINRIGDDEFEVIGDLTINDVTREVKLRTEYEGTATDPWGNERIGFSAQGKVNRKDFGLTWNTVLETGGVLVGDEVRISIEAQAIRSKE